MSPRCVLFGLLLVGASAGSSPGQWMYPSSFGGYGWSKWGNNPNASYMAGIGAYAKGRGQFLVDKARADALERESVVKWNRAVAQFHAQQAAEQAKVDAQNAVAEGEAVATLRIERGATLNELLNQVLEFNPDATKVAAAGTPLPPELVRDIPFLLDNGAQVFCLDQMTGAESWPPLLGNPALAAERDAVIAAVDSAVAAASKGPIPDETLQSIDKAIEALHTQYVARTLSSEVGFYDGEGFLRSLAGAAGMLRMPKVDQILAEIESYDRPLPLGELVRFMHVFNLRFAPAETDRQREIYRQLAGSLTRLMTDLGGPGERAPGTAAVALPEAARSVFQSLGWDDIQAHRAGPR